MPFLLFQSGYIKEEKSPSKSSGLSPVFYTQRDLISWDFPLLPHEHFFILYTMMGSAVTRFVNCQTAGLVRVRTLCYRLTKTLEKYAFIRKSTIFIRSLRNFATKGYSRVSFCDILSFVLIR